MGKRYTALRIIGSIYKALGIIVGVITILGVLSICATSVLGGAIVDNLTNQLGGNAGGAGLFSGIFGGLILGLFVIINGGGIAVTLYALGEGIYLFLAMEENTREISILLRKSPNQESSQILRSN